MMIGKVRVRDTFLVEVPARCHSSDNQPHWQKLLSEFAHRHLKFGDVIAIYFYCCEDCNLRICHF